MSLGIYEFALLLNGKTKVCLHEPERGCSQYRCVVVFIGCVLYLVLLLKLNKISSVKQSVDQVGEQPVVLPSFHTCFCSELSSIQILQLNVAYYDIMTHLVFR